MQGLRLEWHGPFGWFEEGERSIFAGRGAAMAGVYAWTVPIDSTYRVFYIGQTEVGFAARHLQHFQTYFSGAYSIYEPGLFSTGQLDKLHHGFAYKQPTWKNAIPFFEQFDQLLTPLIDHLRLMQMFIAPLPLDRRLQRRVETALMQAVYAIPGPAGQLLEKGLKLEPRLDDEPPISVTQSPIGLLEGVPVEFEA